MSKAKVIVLSVVEQGLSKAEAARRYEVSWRWVHTLVQRYQADGLAGLEPRSRRPHSNPHATSELVRTRILELRHKLTIDGLDAGPATIAWHLAAEGLHPPALSTIRRVLHAEHLIVPEPRKRPKSSLRRFAAEQPNETWQSDFTHWPLADGTDTEILNWLDDHSRYLLACTAHPRVTGDLVVDTFTTCINTYGTPASTLTDNGSVYTSRFTGGRNAFEYLLHALGIQQKNGHPGHPQTQGKIERFHRTLKDWLAAQPPPPTWPPCKPSSTPSAASTTPPVRTGPWAGSHRTTPTTPAPRRDRPAPPSPGTTGCASTTSGTTARSRYAAPGACTTSASAPPTAAPPCSSSSTRPAPPSSPAPPARSWRPAPSTRTAPTGATTNESPADGRALPL